MKRIRSSRTKTITINEYFGDDDIERHKSNDSLNMKESLDEYDINFSMSLYMEFFFYHLIYFVLIGPLISIVLIFYPKARFLLYNMEFTRPNAISFVQAFYWFITVFIIVGFILQNTKEEVSDSGVFDSPILKTIVTSIVLRTTSIAGKYATYSRQLISKYKTQYIDKKVILNEFMLVGWLTMGADVRYQEVKNCISRLEIDKSTLALSFMAKVSGNMEKAIEEVHKARGEVKAGEESEVKAPGELFHTYKYNQREFKYVRGDLVFETLLAIFNKTVKLPFRIGFGWTLGILWAFAPNLLRLADGQNFHGQDWMEITATYMNGLLSSFLFFVQYMFYVQAITDLSRKYFVMCQLGFMLSPKKLKLYNCSKHYPTISILDTVSLNSWYNMRRMSLDFGRKYMYRHEIFLPVNLLLVLFNVVFYFTVLYMIRIGNLTQTRSTKKLMYTCIIDGCCFVMAGFHFLYKAGYLNSEFDSHIGLIQKNRALVASLLQFRHYYFHQYINSKNKFGRDMKLILPHGSDSALHRKMRQEVLFILGDELKKCDEKDRDRLLQDYFQEIIQDYDKLSDDLEHEKIFEQVKVLNITITRTSVLNLLIGLVSAIFTIYQLLFPNGN